MKSVNSIEKKKLVFYRNLIDSLLSLEGRRNIGHAFTKNRTAL